MGSCLGWGCAVQHTTEQQQHGQPNWCNNYFKNLPANYMVLGGQRANIEHGSWLATNFPPRPYAQVYHLLTYIYCVHASILTSYIYWPTRVGQQYVLLRVQNHAWSALQEFLASKNDVKSKPPWEVFCYVHRPPSTLKFLDHWQRPFLKFLWSLGFTLSVGLSVEAHGYTRYS